MMDHQGVDALIHPLFSEPIPPSRRSKGPSRGPLPSANPRAGAGRGAETTVPAAVWALWA